ncbi:REP-associated tyrosine transposase [Panacagrimonas sp.]|uniref:REP-associated tyrosine transposase n=1 Tax=Panacagrimonas sp. TaxID=2480088 RepID=UPI003B51F5E5
MVQYRRARIPGGSFFFTVTLADRHSSLLIDHVDALRGAFRQTRARHPFSIDAIVVLPDHLHSLWTLPPGDADFPARWQGIKTRFTRALMERGLRIPRHHNGEPALWQRRYWEHAIRDDEDRRQHFDYILFNPVKHGLVRQVRDWPHSSFHRHVRQGLIPSDWGGTASGDGDFGERRA